MWRRRRAKARKLSQNNSLSLNLHNLQRERRNRDYLPFARGSRSTGLQRRLPELCQALLVTGSGSEQHETAQKARNQGLGVTAADWLMGACGTAQSTFRFIVMRRREGQDIARVPPDLGGSSCRRHVAQRGQGQVLRGQEVESGGEPGEGN